MEKKIIFVGSFVSSSDSLSHFGFSQAANLYQEKFINFTNPELIISVLPIFFNEKKKFTYQKNVRFINNQSGLKNKFNYLYRLLVDTLEIFNTIRKSNVKDVFFYNLDYQNFIVVSLVKFILNKNVFVIIADYDNYKGRLIDKIYIKIFKKINGVIALNSNIKSNINSKLLLGLLYRSEIEVNNSKLLNRNVILSGSLGKTTGLEFALEFFSKNQQYNLFITGRPFRYDEKDFNSLIQRYQSNFNNIKYLGLLDYKEYVQLLKDCDVALSFRNPSDDEHNYNFPSKILEYLSKSKIVISTKEYPDLEDGLLFYTDYTIDSLSQIFERIYSLDGDEVLNVRNNIYQYLRANFTEEHTVEIVNELIK
ncbi:hypothetical protein AAYQ05_18480 [Flavobacterium sp. B11]|uniref:hypothetical protein n=1 Tax=Flavobacterium movens TaxID=214860 RepID=UPI0031DCC3CF